jgi:hypothetical protein
VSLLLGFSGPAHAFHRSSPPVIAVTSSGDTDLPRVPSQGRRSLVLVQTQGIAAFLPFSTGGQATMLANSGGDPAVSLNGRTIAWEADDDPLERGLPGWQIVLSQDGNLSPGVTDPSGTSANPSLDKRAGTLVFESAGDLTGTGGSGVTRVYARTKSGELLLVSTGSGQSGKAMLGAKGGLVAFESTSDPVSGVDTGIGQIWLARLATLPATRVTGGAAPSTDPTVSDDGRLIVFASQAALATDGADTGVSQVFAYDTKSETFAQITDEPGGCSRPAASKVRQDWRIAYVCGGEAFYTNLRENRRYHVPTPGGTTQAIVPEMGAHFVTVSTTANLLAGSGATPGHQIYILNLFKAPAPTAAGSVTWFPTQGIPGL